ncbi:uncharacterized protein LOC108623673, partial [Ceratina calcarata]|uniref:Uncharacterized protein LOC108623673 n=1 Tax=Ceratina calcarata TaxID=156304 RepID=A0AAJ7RYV3_9HYME
MNSSIKSLVTLSLLLCSLSRSSESKDAKDKSSRSQAKTFGKHPNGGLISFDSGEKQFSIDFTVTIPFITLPLERRIGENGESVSPLLNINSKGLGIVGLLTTLLGITSPLLSKTHHHYNYRTDSGQWLEMGSMNEILFGNNYVVPCVQRVVCSLVSVASHTENPTSMDKIIDGLSSHKWFKDATNGTIVQDAVATGRKGDYDCAHVY